MSSLRPAPRELAAAADKLTHREVQALVRALFTLAEPGGRVASPEAVKVACERLSPRARYAVLRFAVALAGEREDEPAGGLSPPPSSWPTSGGVTGGELAAVLARALGLCVAA